MNIFIYVYHGLVEVLCLIGSFFRYFLLGIIWIPSMIFNLIKPKKNIKNDEMIDNSVKEKAYDNDKLLIQAKKEAFLNEKRDEEERKKVFIKKEKDLKQITSNNSVFLEKDNTSRKKVRKIKKQKEINMPELTVDFNGADAVKSEKKQMYRYLIKTPDGEIVKEYFAAYSKAEVYSFLKSEGNTIYEIKTSKWINFAYGTSLGSDKFKTKDLIFFIAQLSTYLKAGISLSDSCKILVKQFNSPKYKRILKKIIYDLTIGLSFSEALSNQDGAFPPILINMIKTAEMTGELPETLDDMEEYFSQIESTRKAMVTAMTYPAIIFVIAIGVGTFIMLYVVPKFVDIYKSMDGAKIPWITTAVLGFSNFLQNYIVYLGILFILMIGLFIYLYKNVKPFRRIMQLILMHLPVFGNVIIYNEVTTFTKTFASLLSHNVFITDSMEILNVVTGNEIYKELISDAIGNVSRGRPVSMAFENHWAFPIPAYEMIVTGEKTGQLPEMMQKVSVYYQDLHKNSVSRIKTFIEPAIIILLTGMVGIIVLSIVIPMFSMYSQIQA